MARRMSFINEAVTIRELGGWPNDPVHNAAIIYWLHGWTFDNKDAEMIRAEAAALRARTEGGKS
jgi:hypothetical protein